MSGIFSSCSSLKSFLDISICNTDNVTNISDLFSCCNLLTSLPDISNWNTNNIADMSKININI